MGDEKSERLGLRGRLAHMESALRLLGGANATGAIAAAVAFHTFENNAVIQIAVKTAAVLFLFGIFTFTIAYAALFLATEEIDRSMHKQGEETWPEYLFWVPDKSAEEHKTMAKWVFGIALFGGLASFSIFIVGLAVILFMATHFQLGS
jgi:hypothetical protein